MSDQLNAGAAAVDLAAEIVDSATEVLARRATVDGRISVAKLDEHQVLAYDLAHAASAVEGCTVMVAYGEQGEQESLLARAYIADAIHDLGAKLLGREATWGVDPSLLAPALPFVETHRSPEFLEALGDTLPAAGTGPNHLPDDFELAADTFHKFAEEKIRPHAEHVHRSNGDVPEEVIQGLAELGGFGLSVPVEYDGMAGGGEADYLGMVVATEELSWGSLGIGGSLITRPEILTRALVTGGTDEQKRRWLPRIASGELIVGVMATEPDFGSDVAGVSTMATPTEGGYLVNGVKTWATFAGRADLVMLLVRTDPDKSKAHRGLSLFVVEKEPTPGHSFSLEQEAVDGRGVGKMEGRAIDTLGYRGMHSFEVSFSDWFVPAANLVGEESGLGRGFYLQMEGFENGRLQTAARAVGLMQAAFDAGLTYAQDR
ncbi:MAG: acyl-CoA dehydrogenase family protein, partial [Acidimicrobiia bacterium]